MSILIGIGIGFAISFFFGVWLPCYREQTRMHRFTATQIRDAVERCKRNS